MSPLARDLAYLVAAALFVLGLRRLSSARTAVSGNACAAAGMLLAVGVTLLDRAILDYGWIVAGLAVGSGIGALWARTVPMTAMPQMVGILNGLGGGASGLVAVVEFGHGAAADGTARFVLAAGCLVGALTFSGSLVAYGKLQGLLPGAPVTWSFQRAGNVALLAAVAAAAVAFTAGGADPWFHLVLWGGVAAGALFVLPIGGGDMPVVISLLNSCSGLAASLGGFVLDHKLLIVAGALVGASGFILTRLMCVAMNRSIGNVIFGAFGKAPPMEGGAGAGKPVRATTPEDAAILLAHARLVVIVPGYGLAVARAQHTLREMADLLAARGVEVKYAIHPVAGRMPGHMNVLLAEADVPYERLFELDRVNPDFDRADVALVVGANDVVNPAARSDRSSPLYGMPILNADRASAAIVLKRSMRPGFAGVENELFHLERTRMLFGDADDSLGKLVAEVKKL